MKAHSSVLFKYFKNSQSHKYPRIDLLVYDVYNTGVISFTECLLEVCVCGGFKDKSSIVINWSKKIGDNVSLVIVVPKTDFDSNGSGSYNRKGDKATETIKKKY